MSKNNGIAFISGANRGIGLQTARELGALGYRVVLGARDEAKGTAAARQLTAEGLEASSVVYDAARPETAAGVYEYLKQRFGRLDVLVNNAGELKEEFGISDVADIEPSLLQSTFDTNFFGVVKLTQALLPLLRASEAGRIVNVSSILGSLTVHSAKDSPIATFKAFAYNASKTALNAFTVHLAHELRDTPIKVNSAHPGWVKTEMGGPRAPMEVADSARTSVWLATLGADGPSGGFFHEQQALGW